MRLVMVIVMLVVGPVATCGEETPTSVVDPSDEKSGKLLANTELVLVFSMFRHGDRTPDLEELALYPPERHLSPDIYFPFGKKALTNKGKQRSYFVGQYLRDTYDGFISRLYLPDESVMRTTDFARTQMTALAALSALYPPLPVQKWNPNLDWQPIPYKTESYEEDDLLYWYNCPKYLQLRDKMYDEPEVMKWIEPYQGLLTYLSNNAGNNYTKPKDVFFLDNLFQTLKNVGVPTPTWAQDVMPGIKNMTKIEYAVQFYNDDLTRLGAGVLMRFILNEMGKVIQNPMKPIEPKLHMFSAHENNIAALMSASKVFEPHQPGFGATFSLELRRNPSNNSYGVAAIYAAKAGGPDKVLPVGGCGGQLVCDYKKFVMLTQNIVWTKDEFFRECNSPL